MSTSHWYFSDKLSFCLWTTEFPSLTDEWLLTLAAIETTAAAEQNPQLLRAVGQRANDLLKEKELIGKSISDFGYLDITEDVRASLIKLQDTYFSPQANHPALRRGIKEGKTYQVIDDQVKTFAFPANNATVYLLIKGTTYIGRTPGIDPIQRCKQRFYVAETTALVLVAYAAEFSLRPTGIEGVDLATVPE